MNSREGGVWKSLTRAKNTLREYEILEGKTGNQRRGLTNANLVMILREEYRKTGKGLEDQTRRDRISHTEGVMQFLAGSAASPISQEFFFSLSGIRFEKQINSVGLHFLNLYFDQTQLGNKKKSKQIRNNTAQNNST